MLYDNAFATIFLLNLLMAYFLFLLLLQNLSPGSSAEELPEMDLHQKTPDFLFKSSESKNFPGVRTAVIAYYEIVWLFDLFSLFSVQFIILFRFL